MIEVELKIEQDRRYRCLVSLQRSDRPRYWTFHCPNCTMPITELVNAEVVAINDLIAMDKLTNLSVGYRCSGRTGNGRCNIWYYFNLNPS